MRNVVALFLSGLKGPGLNLCVMIWWRRIGRVNPQKRHIFQLVALFIHEYIKETSLKIMQFYFELKVSSRRLNLQQFLWARVQCSTPRTFNDNRRPKTTRNLVWRYCNSVVENWVLEANIAQRQIAGLSSANIMGYFSVLAVSLWLVNSFISWCAENKHLELAGDIFQYLPAHLLWWVNTTALLYQRHYWHRYYNIIL